MSVSRLCSALLLALTVSHQAYAATYNVDAYDNSIAQGVGSGLDTITLNAGDVFNISVSVDDLWSAGALPRFSTADGLNGNLYATATDDSGEAVGTLIGINYGPVTMDGFTANFGQLVGRIGSTYIALGTSYSGVAAESGVLKLYYWDSNFGDNAGKIAVNVTTVPESENAAMLFAGLAAISLLAKRKSR